MAYLFHTNIFLRLTNKADPAHTLAADALRALRRRRETLCFTPQILAEFWSVCTRPPSARGGFGLLPAEAERRARLIASMKVYSITHLLTFNAEDFRRYQDITVIEPPHIPLS